MGRSHAVMLALNVWMRGWLDLWMGGCVHFSEAAQDMAERRQRARQSGFVDGHTHGCSHPCHEVEIALLGFPREREKFGSATQVMLAKKYAFVTI
jgi:hypothetical protein